MPRQPVNRAAIIAAFDDRGGVRGGERGVGTAFDQYFGHGASRATVAGGLVLSFSAIVWVHTEAPSTRMRSTSRRCPAARASSPSALCSCESTALASNISV